MSDIVERLRKVVQWCEDINAMHAEAATEIERLRALSQNNAHSWQWRAEIERLHDKGKQDMHEIMARGATILQLRAGVEQLRAALQTFVDDWHDKDGLEQALNMARRALEPKP